MTSWKMTFTLRNEYLLRKKDTMPVTMADAARTMKLLDRASSRRSAFCIMVAVRLVVSTRALVWSGRCRLTRRRLGWKAASRGRSSRRKGQRDDALHI